MLVNFKNYSNEENSNIFVDLTNIRKLEANDLHGGIGKGLSCGIGRMKKLEYLSIDRCRFDPNYLQFLQYLPELKVLSFKDCKTIHDNCLVYFSGKKLFFHLKKVIIFNFLPLLSGFPSLNELELSGNLISTRGTGILQSLFMGRDDVSQVKIRAPATFQFIKRNISNINIHSDKQLRKIDTIFSGKELSKYISTFSAISAQDITKGLQKIAQREKERQLSFKECSPIVKQRILHQQISENNTKKSSLKPIQMTDDYETESDSDSLLCCLSEDDLSLEIDLSGVEEDNIDIDDLSIEIELSDVELSEKNTSNLGSSQDFDFGFNATDVELPDFEIRIGTLPFEECQTEVIQIHKTPQKAKPKHKRANSIDNSGKENKKSQPKTPKRAVNVTPKAKKVKPVEDKTEAEVKPVRSTRITRQSVATTTNCKPTRKRKVSLCQQFAQITLESENSIVKNERPRRSRKSTRN